LGQDWASWLFILLERALATISSRGPYQWRAKIRRAGYPEQSKTFLTKADAEAWARDIESKIDQGIFIDRSALEKTRLLDILDRYEKEITSTKKGKVQEKSKLKILKNSKLSGLSLAAIRTKDIVNYRNERSKEVAAATVGREINLLSHVFNVARTEWGLSGLSNAVQGRLIYSATDIFILCCLCFATICSPLLKLALKPSKQLLCVSALVAEQGAGDGQGKTRCKVDRQVSV
jgi:hypothetical protein